jgi:hypothetical protein
MGACEQNDLLCTAYLALATAQLRPVLYCTLKSSHSIANDRTRLEIRMLGVIDGSQVAVIAFLRDVNLTQFTVLRAILVWCSAIVSQNHSFTFDVICAIQ